MAAELLSHQEVPPQLPSLLLSSSYYPKHCLCSFHLLQIPSVLTKCLTLSLKSCSLLLLVVSGLERERKRNFVLPVAVILPGCLGYLQVLKSAAVIELLCWGVIVRADNGMNNLVQDQ